MPTFNSKLPDDRVNLSEEHPVKDLVLLLGGIIAVVIVIVMGAGLLLDVLIPKVPVSVERVIFSGIRGAFDFNADGKESGKDAEAQERRTLQRETLGRLLADLSKGWTDSGYDFSVEVTDFGVGIAEGGGPNALALPGGLILVNPELIDGAKSENELAMVLGHELGHFRNRDHLRGLGRGITLQLILAGLGTTGGAVSISQVAGLAGVLVEGRFSRTQESDADSFGLQLVARKYGHVGGATDFFERILKLDERSGDGVGAFFSSHPLSKKRILTIKKSAAERGWEFNESLVPVPWTQAESGPD